MASILTGRFPSSAALDASRDVPAKVGGLKHAFLSAVQLGDGVTTLPEMLRDHGYATAAFSANVMVNHAILGLSDRFDHFDRSVRCSYGDCAGRLNNLAIAWLATREERPWLCYIHYQDVHFPYSAPPEYARQFTEHADSFPIPTRDRLGHMVKQGHVAREQLEHVRGMYDAEIAYLDAEICSLLRHVDAMGFERDLLLVIASDHGDEFYEHGRFGHRSTLYEELTRCPLVFVWPQRIPAGVLVEDWVQNVDIVPTLLDLLSIDAPAEFEGSTLRPIFGGGRSARPAFSEKRGTAVRRGSWKLWKRPRGQLSLFDLESDPTEQKDLAGHHPEKLRSLEAELASWEAGLEPPSLPSAPLPAGGVDSATAAAMRSLGYLE
jgi:arylsulfatase A-like enzyme